ncbi:MAG: ribosomal-processing cysteine protease Prp [Oscillospiraceae bacterium]|nr:ribosomal-processing cysteine protease Prp [Oscillospiraceae bacterium]
MIDVTVLTSGGSPIGVEIRGHAGYAPKGGDIVCAAVSALGYTLVNALIRIVGSADYEEGRGGALTCRMPGGLDEAMEGKARTVVETVVAGLESVRDNGEYSRYVAIRHEERRR